MIEEEPAYEYPVPEEPPVTLTKPEPLSGWERFARIRRLIIFLLGVAIMIDALTDRSYVVPELIVGMIMVGVLPIDDFVKSLTRSRRRG